MEKKELLKKLEKSTRKNYSANKFDINTFVFYMSFQEMWHENMCDPERNDLEYHFTEEEAIKTAKEIKVDIGFTSTVSIITIDADILLENIDIDENIELEDLHDYKRFNYDVEELYSLHTNEGDDLEGAIIIRWNYEKYVGYARNFEGIRYGEYKETESSIYTGNEDSTFRSNESVLLTAKEIENCSDSDILEKVNVELEKSHWKWNYFKNRPTDEKIIDGLGLDID